MKDCEHSQEKKKKKKKWMFNLQQPSNGILFLVLSHSSLGVFSDIALRQGTKWQW